MTSSKVEKNQAIQLGGDYVELQIEAFLRERKAQNLSKATIRYYTNNLKVFLGYLNDIEIKFIHQITPQNIRDFLLILADRGHNDGGVHGYFRAVRAFLNWYFEETEPDYKNPMDKVKAPRNPVKPIEGVSKDDFEKLISACPKNFFGERDKAILMTLLDTGIRASELCNIDMEDVNFADSSILIRQGKGRKPRFVFMGKSTRKQIRKWLRLRGNDGNALFVNIESDGITYTTLREILRRLSRKVGINVSPHDFRRAFCLECLRKGIDLLTISRLMGHTSLQLLSRYAKQTTVDLMDKYKSVVDD